MSALTYPNRFLFDAVTRAHGAADERGIRGPLAALLLGRTAELDRGMVARFRRGGLYHLLVVSGLHVLLAAALVAFALSLLGVEGKRRDVVLLLSVVLFVSIGGANPPAIRGGLVIAIFLVSRLLERPITGAQAVGLSACILFLAAPEQIFSVGTILTFAAVLGIASFARPIVEALPGRPRWLFSGLAASLAAQCATAPVLLWRFNLVAAAAWLTSPLAVPLSAALIGLGGLLLLLDALGAPAGSRGGAVRVGNAAARVDRGAGRRRDVSSPDASALGRARGRSAARGRGSGPFRKDALSRRPPEPRRPFWSWRFVPARGGPRRGSPSRPSTWARETRYSCAGKTGRFSWTEEVPSTWSRPISGARAWCPSCSTAESRDWMRCC